MQPAALRILRFSPTLLVLTLGGCLPSDPIVATAKEIPVGETSGSATSAIVAGKVTRFWYRVEGYAKDLGVGFKGNSLPPNMYMVGNGLSQTYGKKVWKWRSDGSDLCSPVSGTGTAIDVDDEGTVWKIEEAGYIGWAKNPGPSSSWNWLSGPVKWQDIGAGKNTAFAISTTLVPGSSDYSIWKYNGQIFQKVNGGGQKIAVDAAGGPWIVNAKGQVWKGTTDGLGWGHILPDINAQDIAVSGSGASARIWVISYYKSDEGKNYKIFFKDHSAADWTEIANVGGVRISVDLDGNPWIVAQDGQMFRSIKALR